MRVDMTDGQLFMQGLRLPDIILSVQGLPCSTFCRLFIPDLSP